MMRTTGVPMRGTHWSTALMLASGLVWTAGCTDTSAPLQQLPPPRTNNLAALIASAPVWSLTPSAPIRAPGRSPTATAGVVYVSLPPGSVPQGLSATIRDVESGLAVTASVVGGGFDPVAITANVGDTLLVAIQALGSSTAILGYSTVPATQPPVVVRTSPPARKVDVPLNAIMVAVFSVPLDSTTVDSSSVTLRRNTTRVPGTVRFADVTHLRVEFHPDTLLLGATDYQLVLSHTIHDVNGVALDSAVNVPFTTDTLPPPLLGNLVFASVSVGYYYSCGVTTAGAAYCWGDNAFNQLGNSPSDYTPTPTPVPVAGGLTFVTVSASRSHTCGLTTSGAAYCWGEGSLLGDGLGSSSNTPVRVAGGLTFASVSLGNFVSCGTTTTGAAYCWGGNAYGFLGNGTENPSSTPTPVAGGLTFAGVGAGGDHSCGITTTGVAYCWGMNTLGELGLGASTGPEQCGSGSSIFDCSTIPVAVTGGLTFATVSAGNLHSCGVTTNGAAYCWGNDEHDLLGSGRNPNSTTRFTGPEECPDIASFEASWTTDTLPCSRIPRVVGGGLTLASLSTGGDGWFACGLTATGAAYCWGDDRGIGALTTSAPIAIAGGLTFKMLSAGQNSACGVTTAGVAYCWGYNEHGQLGDGTTTSSIVPVKVAGQP